MSFSDEMELAYKITVEIFELFKSKTMQIPLTTGLISAFMLKNGFENAIKVGKAIDPTLKEFLVTIEKTLKSQ